MTTPPNEARSVATLWSRNVHLLVLTMVLAVVAGLAAYVGLPRLEDPRIVHRNPLVLTPVPGASADRVEALVTEPIEEELQQIGEIYKLQSTSRAGISVIAIELDPAVTAADQPAIFSRLRERIDDAALRLPPEALPPVFEDQRRPIAYTRIVAVKWTADSPPLPGMLARVAEELADRFRQLPATELVEVYGLPEEELTVAVDPDELAAAGLTPAQIAARIAAADSKVPAGVLRNAMADLQIEVAGELDGASRIAGIPLQDSGVGMLRVGDVARVQKGWRNPSGEIALVDQSRAVLVAARMTRDARIDDWTATADEAQSAFAQTVGAGIGLDVVFEQNDYTGARLGELAGNLLAGAAVVLLVVLLTMGAKLALIVGASLPMSFGVTLFALQVLGYGLHQMVIFGMIIALGLLIDNAIVVADEVAHRRRSGLGRLAAVRATVLYLAAPLTSSTLTTILAFAPITLLPGSAGDFVGSIGTSVILALTTSLVLALTVVAALAGFCAPTSEPRTLWGRLLNSGLSIPPLARSLRAGLARSLRAPVAAAAVACLLPAIGFALSRTLGNEFFPPTERNMFELRLTLPSHSSIDRTQAVAKSVEAVARTFPEVERMHWLVGRSFPTVYYNMVENQDGAAHSAHAIVVTSSAEATETLVPRLQRRLDEELPGARCILRSFGQGPPITSDLQFRLFGPSAARLQDLGDEVTRTMQSHRDVLHTDQSMTRGEAKLWFVPDEDEARLAGLTLQDLSGRLQASLEGVVGGSVREDLENLPVRVRYGDARRSNQPLSRMDLPVAGGSVPLATLGDVELRPEVAGITRYNGRRCNIVRGYVQAGALPIDTTVAVRAALEENGFELPPGYELELGGAIEQDEEAVGNLAIYAPILGALMIATLILALRSMRVMLVLFGVGGLSAGLALLSTWTMQFPVSFNTILGTLGLIGVALNDSIVVLAAIRANPKARAGDPTAIADAVMGCLRHVISTTLTTMGGFLPLLLFSTGTFWPSLAIVLVGGIAGATLLATLFVPAAYVLLFRRGRPRSIELGGAA